MSPQRKVVLVWLAIAALVVAIAVPVWGPLRSAWLCYQLYADGEREQAEVLEKLEGRTTLVLGIEEGSHAGTSCTAGTSAAIYEATEPGERLAVVYLDAKPGDCELVTTIEASRTVLALFVGLLGGVLTFLIGVGIFLTRSFTRAGEPDRPMHADPRDVRCPACGKAMDEGYVPLVAGLHWRARGEPIGLPHALRGLPGTVGMRGRPKLHAFRCVPCEILTLQYGRPDGRTPAPR